MRGVLKAVVGLAALGWLACGGPAEEPSDASMTPEPAMGEVQAESIDMCLPDGSCPKAGQQCIDGRRCVNCDLSPRYCQ